MLNLHLAPIIETCAPHRFVVGSKTELPNQMQRRKCGRAQSGDVSGVWRDLRLDKRYVKHWIGPVLSVQNRRSVSLIQHEKSECRAEDLAMIKCEPRRM